MTNLSKDYFNDKGKWTENLSNDEDFGNHFKKHLTETFHVPSLLDLGKR